jgi:hypothetical protein
MNLSRDGNIVKVKSECIVSVHILQSSRNNTSGKSFGEDFRGRRKDQQLSIR